ncbi:MAG: hypothetical protein JO300_10390 [Silvibacterium sp.]|nr:hypothetical protein [Silvibacterium sp.]
MNIIRRGVQFAGCSTAALILALSLPALGQEGSATNHIRVTPDIMDRAAAADARDVRTHVMRANTQAAKSARAVESAKRLQSSEEEARPATTPAPLPGFYPADLDYSRGPVVITAQFHNVYVNCTNVATCWGDPSGFLGDLGKSKFIHITDQYVGAIADNRYTVGTAASVTYPFYGNTLYPEDIYAIAHAVAKALKATGYGHIYHIFLPKGTDTCFDQSAQCYSPDNPAAWIFCAYHESVTFSDIGHVLYTVEPYQNVPGCYAAKPNPHSQLIDSTNSVLSHETFETITDPDPPLGWANFSAAALFESEIGDECVPLGDSTFAFLDPTFLINGKPYEVQLEYSNKYHACVSFP